jgi:hypothetical protein
LGVVADPIVTDDPIVGIAGVAAALLESLNDIIVPRIARGKRLIVGRLVDEDVALYRHIVSISPINDIRLRVRTDTCLEEVVLKGEIVGVR